MDNVTDVNCTGLSLLGIILANCTSLIPEDMRGLKLIYNETGWSADLVQSVSMLSAVMAATLVGNVTILYVLTCSKHRKRNSRVNVFLVNLAIGDLSILVFTMTTELLFVVFDNAWLLGAVLCKLLLYIQIITLASTTFILTAMSFDRYMAICRPLSFANTHTRARKMIVISWLLALVFASPQLVIFCQVPTGIYSDGTIKYKCLSRGYTAEWQRKLYFTFLTSYILVIPACLISFCYINVVKVVWQQGQEARQSNGVALRKSIVDKRAIPRAKIKTIKMTLAIICTFIICWTPYFVVHLIEIWSDRKYKVPNYLIIMADNLALWNSALNPILYGFFNIQRKRRLREVICPCMTTPRNYLNATIKSNETQLIDMRTSVEPNRPGNYTTIGDNTNKEGYYNRDHCNGRGASPTCRLLDRNAQEDLSNEAHL